MPDIEFQDVVGQIQQTAERETARREAGDPAMQPERLRRTMREERERAAYLAERLMP